MTKLLKFTPEKANPRILLVDDEPLELELNAMALIRFGYDVDTAEDGVAAWKALHNVNVSYNLVITDNRMPRVTGLELIKKLRSEEMTLPVILASGTMPTQELKWNPWLRINATLPKPFTPAELLYTVKKVLLAADSAAGNPELFKDNAMLDTKISQTKESANAPIRGQINPSYRILVVDDDHDTRQLSLDVLAGSGYDADGVTDGAAGWKVLQTGNNYDLVVTDNKMPNMTGLEMIEKLRSARITVPVIMATQYLPTQEFISKPWLTPDATLQRPFSNDDLLETVKKVLSTNYANKAQENLPLPTHF